MDYQPRAVIVGAGPNGLTAAARLAMAGWSVDIYERAGRAGGAAASSTEISRARLWISARLGTPLV